MKINKLQRCPICNSPAEVPDLRYIKGNHIDCFRCGKYKISTEAIEDFGGFDENQIALISGWIRENSDTLITDETFKIFKELDIPTVGEKAVKLLKYIAKERPIPGRNISIDFQTIFNLKTINEQTEYPEIVYENLRKYLPYLSITWTVEGHDLRFIIEEYLIKEKNYLEGNKKYRMTPKGWAFLESLKYSNVDSQMAFIAMWFDKSVDNLYSSIEKTIIKIGYEPKRVDRHEHINRIDDEIIALIRQSKFIIADYTGQRGGVYFESGFAQGLGLPVVWTCRKDDLVNLHFDTSHFNFLTWEEDNLSDFEKRLKNRILAVIGKGTYNP